MGSGIEQPGIPRQTQSPWLAMEVRPWLALTLVLLAVAAITSAYHMIGYLRESSVIRNGPLVDASVAYIGRSYAREGARDEELYVCLDYTAPDGKSYETWNDLPRKPGELLSARQVVPIHIDPGDYHYWTARDAPPPLGLVLAVPLLCLPAAALCTAIAWMKKRGVTQLILRGTVRPARVVNVKLSALAPVSKLIGLNLTDDSTGRVLHCYWPTQKGPVQAGDAIHVVADPAGKRCVLA